MSAQEALGVVSDRLVGGLMFHSEHADMCRCLGVTWLSEEHEDGFLHDSKCMRRVRRLCIRRVGVPVKEGRQERGTSLDGYRSKPCWDMSDEDRAKGIRDSMREWVEWESETVKVLTKAYAHLFDLGELALADKVRKLISEASDELAHARETMAEMEACGYDLCHIYDMG